MIADVQDKWAEPASFDARTVRMSQALASDSGCQLNDEEKTAVARQLREAICLDNILVSDADPLVQILCSVVISYPCGANDISCISSSKPPTPCLVTASATLSPPAMPRLIPLIPLLKLATCRMTA